VPGYLSHLAARAFGTRPAVRPRIASLFELESGTAIATDPQPGGIHVIEQKRFVPQGPASVPTAAPPPAEAPSTARTAPAETAPAAEPALAVRPRRREAEAVDAEAQSSPVPARRLRPRSESVVQTETQPLVAEHVPVRREPRAAGPEEDSPRMSPGPAQRLSDSLPDPARPERAEPRERPSKRSHHEEFRAQFIQPAPERAPSPPAVPPDPTPAPQLELRPMQRVPRLPEPNTHESPSVQVTIGRLIVEAVAPAPHAAPLMPARPPVPRLSLDDYLRQRRSQA
jgi:hypothetical protein